MTERRDIMKTKYEIRYYDFKDKKKHTEYTDSFVKFMIIRLTKEVIYYKVSYENKYDDYLLQKGKNLWKQEQM